MTLARENERTAALPSLVPKRRQSWMSSRNAFGLFMTAPAILVLLLVLIYPSIVALQSSFYRIRMVPRSETFVGFQNYVTLWNSPEFWDAFQRSVKWKLASYNSRMRNAGNVVSSMFSHASPLNTPFLASKAGGIHSNLTNSLAMDQLKLNQTIYRAAHCPPPVAGIRRRC